MIVVDTNVVVYLLLGGDRARDAEALLARDPAWHAPVILVSELRNVLVGFVRRGDIGLEVAVNLFVKGIGLFKGEIWNTPGHDAMAVAIECKLSAYDAEYVVLARSLGAPLATMDKAILRGAPDVASPPA